MRCKKCKNQSGIASIGQCSKPNCGNTTSSGANKYCETCAKQLNCCERCGKKLS